MELKQLRYRIPDAEREGWHEDDCARLCTVALDHGYALAFEDAHRAWTDYSNSYAAGWLFLDAYSDDQLWTILQHLCEPLP